MERKKPHCSYCKNHGKSEITRQHNCPYKINNCDCILCQLTAKSQTVMRHQQRVWRFQNQKNKNSDSTRFQKCDNCRNHLEFERKSSHECPYKDCTCDLCDLTKNRREIMKHLQRARRLGVTMQSPCDENENVVSGYKMSIEDYNSKTSEGPEIQRLLKTDSEQALKKYVGEKESSPASSDVESIESGHDNYDKVQPVEFANPRIKLKKGLKSHTPHKRNVKSEKARSPIAPELNHSSRSNSIQNECLLPKKEEYKYFSGRPNNFCQFPSSCAPPTCSYNLYHTRQQESSVLDPPYSYPEAKLSCPSESFMDTRMKIKSEVGNSPSGCSIYSSNYRPIAPLLRPPTRMESSSIINDSNYMPYPPFYPPITSHGDAYQHLNPIFRPKPILAKPSPHSLSNLLYSLPPYPPAYYHAAYARELSSILRNQYQIASELLATQQLHRP